ncbi:MAG: ATP-binding protein [Bacteroidota bacterium]
MHEPAGEHTHAQDTVAGSQDTIAERNYYRALFDAATDLIIVLDPTRQRIIETNLATREALGYSEAQLANAPCLDFFISEDADAVCAHISRPEENGSLLQATLRRSDGGLLPIEISIVHFDLHGDARCVAICRDVTERRATELELIRARENAEHSNHLKSVFLASMSHELRTPMNAILGFSELLCEELDATPQHRMAEIINTSGHRLLETLNSILDLSLIEADRMEVLPEMTNVLGLAEEVCLLFKPLAKRKGLHLECLCEETTLNAWIDPRLLRQIINNLVGNAIKFTSQGYVHLLLRLDMFDAAPHIRVDVVDTGIGISDQNISLIFEEFRQVSEGYGRRYEGSGLGLAITQKFAAFLGGRIDVQSAPGEGSRFSVLVPFHAGPGTINT